MATKIWFCRNCGYEVPARGRCHSCGVRLERSPLEELPRLEDDEEVGYDLDGWDAVARARLIVALIEAGVEHRFEDEELVVAIDDEERTDDLVTAVTASEDGYDGNALAVATAAADAGYPAGADEDAEGLRAEVQLLAHAAQRLRADPTDMHADADVAQASAAVFVAEDPFAVGTDAWAAVGRVTRRLLAALGADEALEDEIRKQAAILAVLLEPVTAGRDPDQGGERSPSAAHRTLRGASRPVAEAGDEGPDAEGPDAEGPDVEGPDVEGPDAEGPGGEVGPAAGGEAVAVAPVTEAVGAGGLWVPDETAPADAGAVEAGEGEAVYDLPDWLPEQRAQLSVLLDGESIPHRWQQGDLVLPEVHEAQAEALFDRVDGVDTPEDDEARYRALEELFAAADRFVNDPNSTSRAADVVRAVGDADGTTPLGLDDAQWWAIRTRARTLADAIEHGGNKEVVLGEATTLRDLLRAVV